MIRIMQSTKKIPSTIRCYVLNGKKLFFQEQNNTVLCSFFISNKKICDWMVKYNLN